MKQIKAQMVIVIGKTVTESTVVIYEDRGVVKGITHGTDRIDYLFPEGGLQQVLESVLNSDIVREH